MRARDILFAGLAALVVSTGHAQQTTPTGTSTATPVAPVAQVPSTVEDRIALSANGSSLTNTNGGGGGSLGWLHNFNADTLLGVAAEHQVLSVSHWSFGSVNGSMTLGPSDQRYTLFGEAHEGAGDDGPKAFKYRVEDLGLAGTYFHRFTLTAEDKQVDVETTHGNLPKLQVAYLWSPHLLTTVSYQDSISGNLGTRLTSGRIDVYTAQVNWLAGFATGQAAPSVLGINLTLPPRDLREGYVGLSKSIPSWHSDVTLIADYQRLSGHTGTISNSGGSIIGIIPNSSTRWTGTLNYVYHIAHHGS